MTKRYLKVEAETVLENTKTIVEAMRLKVYSVKSFATKNASASFAESYIMKRNICILTFIIKI